jgi:hypothetical protein
MFGYCDFALGAFGIDKPIKEGAKEIICADWTCHSGSEQPRWESLLDAGFISESEADAWAEEVWPSEDDEEDEEEEIEEAI